MALTLNGTSGIIGAGIGTIGPSGANVTGVVTCTSVVSSGAVSGTTGTFTGAVSGTTGTFTGDVSIADAIVHTGDNSKIRFPSNDTITAETGGTERFRINNTGNVGLSSVPTASVGRLQVLTTDNVVARFQRDNTSNYSAAIQFGNNSRTWALYGSNSACAIQNTTGGQVVLEADTSHNVKINAGNLVIGTAGKGIDFSATAGPTQGSGTSELFDDYEEGTWTPTLGGISQNPTSIGYANQNGLYRKIGNQVTVWMRIRVNAITMGSASGTGIIMGLPFNNAGTDAYEGATVGWNYYTNWNGLSNKSPSGYMSGSQNYIRITLIGEGANSGNWQITDCTNNLNIYGNMTYITSS